MYKRNQDHTKVQQWLDSHSLTLEENFPEALKRLAGNYKRNKGYRTLDEVYALIGITKQNISYWLTNLCHTQTKKFSLQSGYESRGSI